MNKIKDLNKTQCCQDVSSSQLDLQIQSKMNVKCKTTKFLKDNIVENLDDHKFSDRF